ncbi:YegP family protein [Thauera sp. SDU_THAU2]|uniref:YegP family protein n=1 Tax=Thauera sp. SDU_THAU2 TaxID=3136633 RepID=UPI004054DEF5
MTRRFGRVIFPAQGGPATCLKSFARTQAGTSGVLRVPTAKALCHSEVYTSKQSAQAGVDAAKRVAPLAQVHDRT